MCKNKLYMTTLSGALAYLKGLSIGLKLYVKHSKLRFPKLVSKVYTTESGTYLV